MELVLRPVNDRFFHEQVLPFLTLAMSDSARALQSLRSQLADEEARLLCERLLSSHVGGGLGGVEQEPWAELVDRVAFRQWGSGPVGWEVVGQRVGYAGDWDDALHLALMVEDPTYPYADARAAHGRRDGFRQHPGAGLELASLIGGQWEPFPSFPPDRVFSTQGRGGYVPREQYAFADWSWRPARTVSHWHVNLERKLRRLLEREKQRLAPVELPELGEVLAYWLGTVPQPPALSVAFSGLGQRASSWIHELGVLTSHVREAAHEKTGLVSLVLSGRR
ncbi:hypothetical protein [Vitiosangium sp. GDMCC 1.1324]|uniref:hypothetical protein n=1 Tax=Vitiosangium sp. (strain GDMCC 1.1324) TaxID=2138576 RepID=UPI000D3C020E|nr:hypothetical protein [Vitiosangium sp. GDMCC 1.1324]PTL76391.1 hypothetical protein DAT35_49570 [Vitiosangium sp. GDMCC 1.1324]